MFNKTISCVTACLIIWFNVGAITFFPAEDQKNLFNPEASIGLGVILNTGCSIDHDCVLGDAVHISPGVRLAGGVHVGDLSWVGIGASVRQLVRIGVRVIVGAGSTVVCDVPNDLTVAGVPAKRMR